MRARHVAFSSVLALSAVTAACTAEVPTPPAAPAAPATAAAPQQVVGTLNQVMRGILFPNSNIIFDSQDRDPGATVDPADAAAAAHPFAGTYGGWQAVENASIALGEAANLVALPGRSCANGKPVPLEDDVFQKGLAALREVSAASYKAAQAKSQDQMLEISDKLTQACSTCHDVYRDRIVDGKPIPIEDRCVK
jgi:hypothetical protein